MPDSSSLLGCQGVRVSGCQGVRVSGLGLGFRVCKPTKKTKTKRILAPRSVDPGIRRSKPPDPEIRGSGDPKNTGSGDPGIRRSKPPNPEIRGSGDPEIEKKRVNQN